MLHLCGHGSSSFLLILKRNPAFIQEAAGTSPGGLHPRTPPHPCSLGPHLGPLPPASASSTCGVLVSSVRASGPAAALVLINDCSCRCPARTDCPLPVPVPGRHTRCSASAQLLPSHRLLLPRTVRGPRPRQRQHRKPGGVGSGGGTSEASPAGPGLAWPDPAPGGSGWNPPSPPLTPQLGWLCVSLTRTGHVA